MVTPVSLEPPCPGDGSGICERPKTRRERYEEAKQEARAEYYEEQYENHLQQQAREQYRHEQEQRAFRAFRELFGDGE